MCIWAWMVRTSLGWMDWWTLQLTSLTCTLVIIQMGLNEKNKQRLEHFVCPLQLLAHYHFSSRVLHISCGEARKSNDYDLHHYSIIILLQIVVGPHHHHQMWEDRSICIVHDRIIRSKEWSLLTNDDFQSTMLWVHINRCQCEIDCQVNSWFKVKPMMTCLEEL